MSEWNVDYQTETVNRDQLILDHIPLLRHIAGRMCFDAPGQLERDDLYGYGMLGLITAADSWEPERGHKFSTYAYTRIRGAILDEIRRMDFLPRGRRERVRDVEQAVQRLEQENGVPPSPEQLAAELDVTVEEIDETLHSATCAMQASLDDGPNEQLGALLSDPKCADPEGSAEWDELKEKLVDAIKELSEQEQTVITLYYAEGLLLKEISEVLGVTESRVSQVHSRAIYRLNRTFCSLTGKKDA